MQLPWLDQASIDVLNESGLSLPMA